MGSYGIGPARTMGVIAEKTNDEKGLCWPEEIAPYKYYLIGIGEKGNKEAENLYNKNPELFIFDDREKVRNGEKFADAELMGIPYRVVISDKTLENNQVEIVERKTGKQELLTLDNFVSKLQ
jgi:prolyl-tRNA synthetase